MTARAPGWVRALPNALTGLRLALAALFPFVAPDWRLPIVVVAGVSDALDGWIARRFDAMTVVGAVLDGVADKAFVLAVLGGLLMGGELALGQALLLLARDSVVGLTFLFVLWHREWRAFTHMAARLPGKLTTAVLFAWFVAVLAAPLEAVAPYLFWLGAALSLWAAVDYGVRFILLVRALRLEDAPASERPPRR